MISSSHPAFAKLGPKLERVQREIDSLDDFLRRYDSLVPEMISEWGRTTAVASAVANAYNGIEDVLTNIARDIDGAVPQGESWHQDLLDQMRAELRDTRTALLDERLHGLLTELKGFRHRVRHNYGFDLDTEKSNENLERLREAFPAFVEALRNLERSMTRELSPASFGVPAPPVHAGLVPSGHSSAVSPSASGCSGARTM